MARGREAVVERSAGIAERGREDAGPALVLFDADVPSVLALAYAVEEASLRAAPGGRGAARPGGGAVREPSMPLVMPAYAGMPEARARASAMARAIDVLGTRRVGSDVADLPAAARESGEAQTRLLVDAAYTALAHGCDNVVWPVQLGEDLRSAEPSVDRVARAIDRAMLVSRVASLDAGAGGLDIQTPLVDLSDHQIAQMVMDIEAPLVCCWWWGGTSPEALAAHDRWGTLLRSLGWGGALGPS